MDQRDAFAAELRQARADAGLSLADLARHAHVNRGYLGHVEHAQRWPSRPVVAALDRALAADGRLIAAWTAADTTPLIAAPEGDDALSLPLDEWTPSDATALADRITGGDITLTLTPTVARRVVHEWLVAETPHTVEIAAGRRIGASAVETVTRRVAQLRRVDDHIGGRELRSPRRAGATRHRRPAPQRRLHRPRRPCATRGGRRAVPTRRVGHCRCRSPRRRRPLSPARGPRRPRCQGPARRRQPRVDPGLSGRQHRRPPRSRAAGPLRAVRGPRTRQRHYPRPARRARRMGPCPRRGDPPHRARPRPSRNRVRPAPPG
ncbi:MAG: helix-turn-helix domain-containing protein [Pseudonocardiaceae bacterium]|nr:helix-turn-helix domain-containing protein [Pseudonocardiaceae bacterium]